MSESKYSNGIWFEIRTDKFKVWVCMNGISHVVRRNTQQYSVFMKTGHEYEVINNTSPEEAASFFAWLNTSKY